MFPAHPKLNSLAYNLARKECSLGVAFKFDTQLVKFKSTLTMKKLEKLESFKMKEQIIAFLEKINYNYQLEEDTEDQSLIKLGVELKIGSSNGLIIIHNRVGLVECYATAPVNIPESHRLEVSKYIDIANAISYLGHLQMNHTNGHIRSKTYYRFQEEGMHEVIIQDNLTEVFHLLDKLIPGIMNIVYGGRSAEEAIEELINGVNPKNN